jgi:diamine N-acetyltransferase
VSLSIRAARPADSALIFALIRELADYEKLTAQVDATEEQIASALFADNSRLCCDIAEWDEEPAGFAVWFLNYSTFRGRGIGTALMQQLAHRCIEQGYVRCEWAVLDWNAPSIAFYKSIGADVLDEWKICRLSGEALKVFARREAAS